MKHAIQTFRLDRLTSWPPYARPRCGTRYIIETFHPHDDIVIATEEHGPADGATGGNPVVEQLLRWRPSIRFPPADFRGDVATLLGARTLVRRLSPFKRLFILLFHLLALIITVSLSMIRIIIPHRYRQSARFRTHWPSCRHG